MIHAEVGDTILIIFMNKASRPYSISAQGVEDTDSGKRLQDTYSGLMGPLITCREGVLNEKGRRSDVDYEFALLFLVFNENESWYLDDNIKKYLNKDPRDFKPSDDFEESNKMHAINGKIFGNLHGLIMNEDTMTNWYLLGVGDEVDIHTIHYHAESFLFKVQPGKEQLYFFGQSLDPRGARAALVVLFVLGLLLLVLSVVLSFKLCSARPRAAYLEVQSCALPTDA
ncbi:HEPHL1, partial [Cervus elaphus hippelaphus]